MAETSHLFDEREVMRLTPISRDIISNLRNRGVLKPARTFLQNVIFFPKHLELLRNVRTLLDNGLTIEQISGEIRDEQLDTQDVLRRRSEQQSPRAEAQTAPKRRGRPRKVQVQTEEASTTSQTNLAADGQLTALLITTPAVTEMMNRYNYSQLVSMARDENIQNFRRMSKLELAVVLAEPSRREAIVDIVRERSRNLYGSGQRNATIPTEQSETTVASPTVTEPDTTSLEELLTHTANTREYFRRSYAELVRLAQEAGILNFRRMSKLELAVVLAEPSRREAIVDIVRERTRSLYGSRR